MFDWLGKLMGPHWFGAKPSTAVRCRRESTRALAASRSAHRKLESSIEFLAQAAVDQELAFHQLEQQYLAKVTELKQCDDKLHEMSMRGYTPAIRSIVSRQHQLEKALPNIKAAVESGQRQRQAMQNTLQQLRGRLRQNHESLRQLHHQTALNQAEAACLDSQAAVQMASQTLEKAQQTVFRQRDELHAFQQLSTDETTALLAALDRLEYHSTSRRSSH